MNKQLEALKALEELINLFKDVNKNLDELEKNIENLKKVNSESI